MQEKGPFVFEYYGIQTISANENCSFNSGSFVDEHPFF